jgi:hypothetical protein
LGKKKLGFESDRFLSPIEQIEVETCAQIEATRRDEARVISNPTTKASNQAEVGPASIGLMIFYCRLGFG